jgi:O-antigen/teichoic acid export membrane protein
VEPVTREVAPGTSVPGGPVPRDSPRVLGSAAVVSAAFLATNALAYVFTVLAARAFAPASYGELAALLSLLLVGSVPATGVQTAAALRLGGLPGSRTVVARLHATALVVGLAVCVLGVLAIAPLRAALHLSGTGALAWLIVLLLPHTLIAGYQGQLQGSGRYRQLAVVTVAFGALKLTGGTAGLLLGGTPSAAMAGMAVGASAGALTGWLASDRTGLARGLRQPVVAAVRTSGAMLGFVVLLNLDLLLARHHLPAAVAGEYAVASIVTKVVFWLPQGIGVVLLPRLADGDHRRRVLPVAVGLVGAAGALLTLATAALGTMALPLIGGSAYGTSLGSATWLFAALGTLLALAQLLLFSGIASADRLAGAAVWTAAGVEFLAVELLATSGRLGLLSIVGPAVGTAAVLVGTGLARLCRPGNRSRSRPGVEEL